MVLLNCGVYVACGIKLWCVVFHLVLLTCFLIAIAEKCGTDHMTLLAPVFRG